MIIDFKNIGFYQIKLTNDQLEPVRKEIKELQQKFNSALPITMNKSLAGHLAREYSLCDPTQKYLNDLVEPYVNLYVTEYETYFNNNKQLKLDVGWVNFQKKSEFNPMHNHSGVCSFVIWIKIPYKIQNEFNENSVKYSNKPVAGCFAFMYNTSAGTAASHIIEADQMYENTLLIFPSNLNHCVYPFYTSDDYRISVAGNFS
jgi:hypothetical protein